MKSKTTSLLLAGLLSISFGSAFAAGESSTGPIDPQTGGKHTSAGMQPDGTHATKPSKTKADAHGRSSDNGAGGSAEGGITGSAVGKTGGPNKNGPNGTGGSASGSPDN